MINEALKYAKKGFYILPVWWIEDGKCACTNKDCPEKGWGKHPIMSNGLSGASNKEDQIHEWWKRYPKANIGLHCAKSGFSVLDYDAREGGDKSLGTMIKAFGDFPISPEALSGSLTDGKRLSGHKIFKHGKDFRLPKGMDLPGIDLRNNAYILVEPSLHRSGETYEWLTDQSIFEMAPPSLPSFLVNPIDEIDKTLGSYNDGTSVKDLQAVSGTEAVRGEVYTFKSNNNGTHQILVNGQSTGAWIAKEGYIGSHSRGGPTIVQWLQWFGHTYEESQAIAKKHCGDHTKKELTLKLAHEYARKHDDTFFNVRTKKFFRYANGYYKKLEDAFFVQELLERVPIAQTLTVPKRNNFITNLQMLLAKSPDEVDADDMFNMENGVFCIKTMKLYRHSKDYYHTVRIPYSLDPKAMCPEWEKALDEILEGDKDKIETLQEFFGYCFTKDTSHEKALFLIGEGGTGKSTVFTMLENLVGRENRSALPLKHFGNNVMLPVLINKLVNISGEMSVKAAGFEEEFRTITSGEPINVNDKFIPSYDTCTFCKLVFSANSLPHIEDKTDGFARRMLVIEFNKQFTDDIKDIDKKQNLKKELPGIFNWAIKGLRRLNKRKTFKTNLEMRGLIKEIQKTNNPMIEWTEDSITVGDDSEWGETKGVVYNNYKNWCERNGCRPMSNVKFSRELYRIYKTVTEKDAKSKGTRYWPKLHLKQGSESWINQYV